MTKLPWFPFYFSDWFGGTKGFSPAQKGIYADLLAAIYEKRGRIERNDKHLARMCGATEYNFRTVLEFLIGAGKIIEADGQLMNPRASKELAKQAQKSQTARENVNQRYNPKRRSETKKRQQNQNAEPTDVEPSTNMAKNEIIGEFPQLTSVSCGKKPSSVGEIPQRNQIGASTISQLTLIEERKKEDGLSTRARAEELEGLLREAAGWDRETAPGLMVVGPILALIDAGADLEADVLPTVRAISPKARSRSSWKFFVNAIAAARDDRVAAAAIVSEPINGANGHGTYRKGSRVDNFAKLDAVIAAFERGENEARGIDAQSDLEGSTGSRTGNGAVDRRDH